MDQSQEIKVEVAPEVKIVYSSYTQAQKKATTKYRETHKDQVNEQRKKYYEARKAVDPAFLEYKRVKAREYYLKKKERLQTLQPVKEFLPETIRPNTPIDIVCLETPTPPEPMTDSESSSLDVEVLIKKTRKPKLVRQKTESIIPVMIETFETVIDTPEAQQELKEHAMKLDDVQQPEVVVKTKKTRTKKV